MRPLCKIVCDVKLVRRKCLSGVFASERVSKFAGWEA